MGIEIIKYKLFLIIVALCVALGISLGVNARYFNRTVVIVPDGKADVEFTMIEPYYAKKGIIHGVDTSQFKDGDWLVVGEEPGRIRVATDEEVKQIKKEMENEIYK